MKKIIFVFSILFMLCVSVFAQSGIVIKDLSVNPTTVRHGLDVTAKITFEITMSPEIPGVAYPCNDFPDYDTWKASHASWASVTRGEKIARDGKIWEITADGPGVAHPYGTPPPYTGWGLVGDCESAGSDEVFYWTASLSKDSVWGSDGSLGIDMGAAVAAEPITFNNNTSSQLSTGSGTYTIDKTITFTVPDNEDWRGNGNKWFLLIKTGGNGKPWEITQNPSTWKQTVIDGKRLTVSSNITIVPNTAWVGDKSSTAKLIVSSSQKMDVWATPSNGQEPSNGGVTYIIEQRDVDVTLGAKGPAPDRDTIPDAEITYVIINKATNAAIRTPALYPIPSVPFTLTSDMFTASKDTILVRATATDPAGIYEPRDEAREWIFARDLPDLEIEFDNYDTSTLVKAEESDSILYETGKFGHGASPKYGVPDNKAIKLKIFIVEGEDTVYFTDDLAGSGQVWYSVNGGEKVQYDHYAGIIVKGSVKLDAWTESEDFDDCKGEWKFKQDLAKAIVELNSLSEDCGEELEAGSVTIYGNSIDLQITFDASATSLMYAVVPASEEVGSDTAKFVQDNGVLALGSPEEFSLSKVLPKPNSSGEWKVITWTFDSENFAEGFNVWNFEQQAFEELVVTPSGYPTERKFSPTIDVLISLSEKDAANIADFCGFGIWYTTDGSNPIGADGKPNAPEYGAADGTAKKYGSAVKFEATVTLKVAAYAENRLPSPWENPNQTHKYRLVADGKSGWYSDGNADGIIDNASVITTIKIGLKPEITLISPFDPTEKVKISEDKITVKDTTISGTVTSVIHVSDVNGFFAPVSIENRRTDFEAGVYAEIRGIEFLDDAKATLSDKVAPIAVTAEYKPGKIIESEWEKTQKIVREPDTLEVAFSESVTRIAGVKDNEIFAFKKSNNTPYTMDLVSIDGNIVKFTVPFEFKGTRPIDDEPADSLSVKLLTIKDGKSVTQENNTKWIPIKENPLPYLLIVKGITPFVAGRTPIPVVYIDFLTILKDVRALSVSGRMFDATGNVVATFDGYDSDRSSIYPEPVTPVLNSTKVLINWDGKNSAGRSVGAGTYRILLSIEGPDGEIHNRGVQIGVGTTK